MTTMNRSSKLAQIEALVREQATEIANLRVENKNLKGAFAQAYSVVRGLLERTPKWRSSFDGEPSKSEGSCSSER